MFPLLLFIIGLKLCFKINIDYIKLLTVLNFLFASFFDPVFKGGVTGAVIKLNKRGCLFGWSSDLLRMSIYPSGIFIRCLANF